MLATLLSTLLWWPRGTRRQLRRALGSALEAFEAPKARRHLFVPEETPAHLTVQESVP
jgi:hypothetical protein